MSYIIDSHTHMFGKKYLELLSQSGSSEYQVIYENGNDNLYATILRNNVRFAGITQQMVDYETRIQEMNRDGVDIAIISLPCPQCTWGSREINLRAAQASNDSMMEAQKQFPDRIRYVAVLPWQCSQDAVGEIERSMKNGALGVTVTASVEGIPLTAPEFHPIWDAIDMLGLPVIIHPDMPEGAQELYLYEHSLGPMIGFMFDTTLAIARMVMDGFFDRYKKLKIVTLHGGGTIPFLTGRMDRIWENNRKRLKIDTKPSGYFSRIYADSTVFKYNALEMTAETFGKDNVVFGTDYPFMPDGMKLIQEVVRHAPDAMQEKIFFSNVQKLFGI